MKIKRSVLAKTDSTVTWNKLVESHLQHDELIDYQNTDHVSAVFFLLANMHAHTMQGGLLLFIDHESGNRYHETVEAAKTIGCYSLSQLMEEIACIFPQGIVPADHLSRRQELDNISSPNYKGELPVSFSGGGDWNKLWDKWEDDYEALQGTLFSRVRDYLLHHAELED